MGCLALFSNFFPRKRDNIGRCRFIPDDSGQFLLPSLVSLPDFRIQVAHKVTAVDPFAWLVVYCRLAHSLGKAQVLLKARPDFSAAGIIKGTVGNDGRFRL